LVAGSPQAQEILKIIKDAGKKGITRKKIASAMRGKGCDCENWINTLLEAGIIEVCGKEGAADLLRVA
jgi:chromosome segregation and condensation protein ScpB